jgi:ketosteroid isomerase-like protein
MWKLTIALALALAAGSAKAPAASGPMDAVNRFVDAFNRGDIKAAAAICTSQSIVIDDFPPHAWQGGNGCATWGSAFVAFSAKNGDTNAFVALGKPTHVDVTGDGAYLVVPATYTFKEHGKPMKQSGSIFTVALQNGTNGWRITGWAWADH